MGRTYNMGSGTGVTVLEVLRACEEADWPPDSAMKSLSRRSGDPGVLIASPEKIIRELGWSPRYSDIREIVLTAWKWHQRHPRWIPPGWHLMAGAVAPGGVPSLICCLEKPQRGLTYVSCLLAQLVSATQPDSTALRE